MESRPTSVLLIENEPAWRRRLEDALRSAGVVEVSPIDSFHEAERVLPKLDLLHFSFAVLDVRMRKHLFDQGGLPEPWLRPAALPRSLPLMWRAIRG